MTCQEYGDCEDDGTDGDGTDGDDGCSYDNCNPYYDCTEAFSEFLEYCQYVECYNSCDTADFECNVDYTFHDGTSGRATCEEFEEMASDFYSDDFDYDDYSNDDDDDEFSPEDEG